MTLWQRIQQWFQRGAQENVRGVSKYTVQFYKGNYYARQKAANKAGAICYVEHHFNSTAKATQTTADLAFAIVARNASQISIQWAKRYAQAIDREFEEITRVGGIDGVVLGGVNGRGNANVKHTAMPAILLEPMFVNDPEHVQVMKSPDGQRRLAQVLVDSIVETFPDGGLVAFSVGHKYKTSRPRDRGAKVLGGGTEAEYAEQVLLQAKTLLESVV